MKESRQDMLRQNFNIFDYIPGETLETQLQRFTTLTTEMNIAGIFLSKIEINKKQLNFEGFFRDIFENVENLS